MQINVKTNKEFDEEFIKLKEGFGEELAELNGVGDRQLSGGDFIDNFVDKTTVADASIDGNANVGHKDIVTLQNEMAKPINKLYAMNKIFHDMTK